MEWTQDQIAAIIGNKELEIIALRLRLVDALEKIKELSPKDNVVTIKEANSGAS